MGNTTSLIKKINFEDMQRVIEKDDVLLINTLDINNQKCLIKNTILPEKEVKLLNNYIKTNKNYKIVIYGMNSCDNTLNTKCEQLNQLGFTNIYVYPGGLFEWLLLQDIYGEELFPTTSTEIDHLKYKGNQQFDILMLKDY
jgi:rhodanese-related sulfurtransferase